MEFVTEGTATALPTPTIMGAPLSIYDDDCGPIRASKTKPMTCNTSPVAMMRTALTVRATRDDTMVEMVSTAVKGTNDSPFLKAS
jgi:hypothetical protein